LEAATTSVMCQQCPDAIKLYGDVSDWRHQIGTGPFILQDFVSSSSATMVRNPNYWDKDPLFPENQLPYLDGVKQLVIADASTRVPIWNLRPGYIYYGQP
jgi:ABC-type transport system substrate-binding protein